MNTDEAKSPSICIKCTKSYLELWNPAVAIAARAHFQWTARHRGEARIETATNDQEQEQTDTSRIEMSIRSCVVRKLNHVTRIKFHILRSTSGTTPQRMCKNATDNGTDKKISLTWYPSALTQLFVITSAEREKIILITITTLPYLLRHVYTCTWLRMGPKWFKLKKTPRT